MKPIDILNSDLPAKKKIEFFRKPNENLQSYIDYYEGRQDISHRNAPTMAARTDKVNRLTFNICEKIVDTAVYFIFGDEPELVLNNRTAQNEILFERFELSYKDSGANDLNSKIGKSALGMSKAAELVYLKNGKIKYQFLDPKKENYYPYFDEKGDLQAFTREFIVKEIIDGKFKNVEYAEIYTAEAIFNFYKPQTEWIMFDELIKPTTNKIPIIYYETEKPIFWKIKPLQDRFNLMPSVLADTNDYFAYPMLLLYGQLVKNETTDQTSLDGMSKNTTKILHMISGDGGERSDAKYLSWDSKPEAAIYEIENLLKMSLFLTSTPDLSFESLKGITAPSGTALQIMFTDALANAKMLQDIFFKLRRRINVHKEFFKIINRGFSDAEIDNMDISVRFKNPIPQNVKELIESLSMAKQNGILSQESAIDKNPFAGNVESEMESINNNSESFNYE